MLKCVFIRKMIYLELISTNIFIHHRLPMGDDRIAAHRTVSVPLTGDSAISQSTSGSGGWFNDRRFNLAGPRQQLQQNINVVLREVGLL
jgi:hypothetical protein